MAYDITPAEREQIKDFLEKNPIDSAYDEACEYLDGDVPEEQLLARSLKKMLEDIEK